jgi:hypothetical protein
MTWSLCRRRSLARRRAVASSAKSRREIATRNRDAKSRREIATTDSAQLPTFQVVPPPVHRVQIRSVARQLFEMDPPSGPTGQEVRDGLAAMDRCAIPDHQEFAGDLAQQQTEKADHIGPMIGRGWGLHQHPSVGGDSGNRRAMIPCQLHPQDGSLPVSRPGAHVVGQQGKPRLVPPDDHSAFVVGFFFSAGQRCSHQRRTASSRRWVARSIGRCTLSPKRCSSRPMWEGS